MPSSYGFSLSEALALRVLVQSHSISLYHHIIKILFWWIQNCLRSFLVVGFRPCMHPFVWFVLLRWGWIFLERTRILSGIQFTTYFIEFSDVQTKPFVGSFVNLILTRQTCGQRSSRAAESKHWAPGMYFCERICYMFLVSKCREDWDLGLCPTSVLVFGEPRRSGDFRKKKTCFDAGKIGFCHCDGKIRIKNRIWPLRWQNPPPKKGGGESGPWWRRFII